jgi:hypothetical protein
MLVDLRNARPRWLDLALAAVMTASPVLAQDTIGTCADLPAHLEACEAFTCTFTHPFTGGEETRTVVPGDDGVCLYRESMPNEGELTCRYDESTRADVAAFYRASFATESSSQIPPEDNPLNAAMADGTCEVKGY